MLTTGTTAGCSASVKCCSPSLLKPLIRHRSASWSQIHMTPAKAAWVSVVCCASKEDNVDAQQQEIIEPSDPEGPQPHTPTLWDGVNWYCFVLLRLLFITDFTPVGAWVQATGSPAAWLAALQWSVFVAPTIYQVQRNDQWRFADTFKLRGVALKYILGAVGGGTLLWLGVSAAVSAKAGLPLLQASGGYGVGTGSAGTLFTGNTPFASVVWLALSPAVAEELLFRGFLLSALQTSLGAIDAAAVCGLAFAITHLSVDSLFADLTLGLAAGFVTVRTNSVLPAIALHLAYNSTGIAVSLVQGTGASP